MFDEMREHSTVSSPSPDTGHAMLTRSNSDPQGFVSRLQTLLPFAFKVPRTPLASSSSPNTPSILPEPVSKFLKLRIMSWNMHDSLPKGDLVELFDSVPIYKERNIHDDADRIRIPGLAMDDGHPYHIIVVAGQECPTLSGIPFGFAGNFKHSQSKDKDKDKEKQKGEGKNGSQEGDKEGLRQKIHDLSKHLKQAHDAQAELSHFAQNDFPPDSSQSPNTTPTSGWTSILEDWFSNGLGSLHDNKPVAIKTARTSTSPPVNKDQNVTNFNTEVQSSYFADFPNANTGARRGTYELLVKERLMGIYTAVYIHRDVKPLVRGVSTDVVPAGLMGGRLGNKGGVGISIDLYGTTLLLINAHLAAHEAKAPLRIANLAKIKTELSLESWLAPDDARALAEDVTDRYDHSWIFGDLNFRLEVSRLHADWLISQKEYSKAFAFDQLHKLMEGGEPVFRGFKEAKIAFPPTFKYDVMHSLKHKKLHGSDDRAHEMEGDESHGEVSNLRPSPHTSSSPERGMDPNEEENQGNSSSRSNLQGTLTHGPGDELMTGGTSINKAEKLIAYIKSFWDPTSTTGPLRPRAPSTRLSASKLSADLPDDHNMNTQASSPILSRTSSANARLQHQGRVIDHDSLGNDKGVYDTSHKHRVPSWCDRILWKTTIKASKESQDVDHRVNREIQFSRAELRSARKGHRFLQIFRSRSDPIGTAHTTDDVQSQSRNVGANTTGNYLKAKPEHDGALPTSPDFDQSKPLKSLPTSFDRPMAGETHSQNVDQSAYATQKVPRRQSLPGYLLPKRIIAPPRRAKTDNRSTVSGADAFRLNPKRWLQRLLSRDIGQSTDSSSQDQRVNAAYRKGDVVCLAYRTLGDAQMRHLEGRSDHRPVIASFAIHI